MNYVLFICSEGNATPEKMAVMQREVPGWVEEMDGRGHPEAAQAYRESLSRARTDAERRYLTKRLREVSANPARGDA